MNVNNEQADNVIKMLIDMKNDFVGLQRYEIAAYLRGVENSFTNKNNAIFIEPTFENLFDQLNIIHSKISITKDKNNLLSYIRNLKLNFLISR